LLHSRSCKANGGEGERAVGEGRALIRLFLITTAKGAPGFSARETAPARRGAGGMAGAALPARAASQPKTMSGWFPGS